MNGRMAVSATIGIQSPLCPFQNLRVARIMTLNAEERHGRRQKFAVHGTVRTVAVDTIFGNIAMLVNEWSALLHVAASAKLACTVPFEHFLTV